ncbi:exodeoxyribonuclease VII large subunit [Granulicella sp. S190]|uniref:exodeoxyribonuclease VII large subunit n=1 Tax=Granulicella sp. S190 TaxID=1747226 RepID=UPI0020B15AE9|nr:exodeoxyribonuclease VII large subunit [Granulicella sp. S190]
MSKTVAKTKPGKIAPDLMPERRIWSVRSLVTNVRQQIETTYNDLWVEGEISNCRPAPSGHIYFTLKGGESQLPVVLFRRQAVLLRFRPVDGLVVLVCGRISVYESRGQLQLIAETMESRGAGALQLAFEQLRARLLAEGLFDAARKRPLPAFPKCIGVVTSLTGSVIRDIVTVVRRRHTRLNLLIYPATMQGGSSPGSVAAGILWFNANRALVDVVVLARGGGSVEDLAGFNDEALARTIAASELPVVSAIGHETDFTIADFAADLRAPTPSAAAELVTAAQHRIGERIAALEARVQRAGRFHIVQARQSYTRLSAEAVLNRLRDAVSRRDQRLDEFRLRLDLAVQRQLRTPAQRLNTAQDRLRRQDFSIRVTATLHRLQAAVLRLERAIVQSVANRETRLERTSVKLEALSPLAVLSRGYALAYLHGGATDGRLLRSVAGVVAGQSIRVRLAQGTLDAEVTHTHLEKTKALETSN